MSHDGLLNSAYTVNLIASKLKYCNDMGEGDRFEWSKESSLLRRRWSSACGPQTSSFWISNWMDYELEGQERWEIRFDGRVTSSEPQIFLLPFPQTNGYMRVFWIILGLELARMRSSTDAGNENLERRFETWGLSRIFDNKTYEIYHTRKRQDSPGNGCRVEFIHSLPVALTNQAFGWIKVIFAYLSILDTE